MGIISLVFVRYNEKLAQQLIPNENESLSSVKSFIFPIFVKIVYFQVFVGIYVGIVILLVPVSPDTSYTITEALLYSSARALQRGI
jgi:hypothetical protein